MLQQLSAQIVRPVIYAMMLDWQQLLTVVSASTARLVSQSLRLATKESGPAKRTLMLPQSMAVLKEIEASSLRLLEPMPERPVPFSTVTSALVLARFIASPLLTVRYARRDPSVSRALTPSACKAPIVRWK